MLTESQNRSLISVLGENENIQFAYLFGSYATGKVTPISDVDIAIRLEDRLDSKTRFNLQLRLVGLICQALQRNDVDLAILNEADIVLRYQILKKGRLIFCRDRSAKDKFFVDTMREYFDTEPMREFYRQKMKEQIKKGKFIGRSERFEKAVDEAKQLSKDLALNRTEL